MDKLMKVFMLLIIQLVTKSSYTTAQCTCSCSSLGQNQDTCDKSAPPLDEQTSSDENDPVNCNCPNQGNIISLLESLQNSVASLKTQLQDVSKSVQDMKKSIPDTIQNRLNVSWTVSPGLEDKDTTYPGDIIWEGVHKTHPRDCKEILDVGDSRGDGLYRIYNEPQNEFNNVWCNMDCDGGGWMVVLRRYDGSVNFNRTKNDYINGFGDIRGEFWMGLEFLHNISNSYKSVVLRIDLVTFDDDHKYSQYINFRLNDKTTNYKLTAGTYSGSAGNSFYSGNGKAFSTYDDDLDAVSSKNCAATVGGGWWFYPNSYCGNTWLTGKMDDDLISAKSGGISYGSSNNYVGYKEVTMKVRPAFEQP